MSRLIAIGDVHGCVHALEALIEDIEALVAPMRTIHDAISDADAIRVIKEGGEKARERASKKMTDVRNKIGVSI